VNLKHRARRIVARMAQAADKTKITTRGTLMAGRTTSIGAGMALLCLLSAAHEPHAAPPRDGPAFALRAPARPAATDAPQPLPPADATQIERLLAGQQLKPGPTVEPAVSADAATDVSNCVDRNIHNVDPSNPSWNDKDPRWTPMRQIIAQDCMRRREYRIKVVQPELQRIYRDALAQSYAQHLSHRDAATLIAFYATPTGRRFQAFQTRLTALEFESMRQVESRTDANGSPNSGSTPPPAAPAPDVMKHRVGILLMSRQILLMVQWQSDAVRTGGDASGGAVAPIMMSMAATIEGEAIDRIEKEFSRDLGAFSKFLSSSTEKSEIRALADAQMSFGKASATQLIKLAPEWNGDLQKWREQYKQLPAAGGASAASTPSSK